MDLTVEREAEIRSDLDRIGIPGSGPGWVYGLALREVLQALAALRGREDARRLADERGLSIEAKRQGATRQWVTRDGYTELPEVMRKDLGLLEGGGLWFLKRNRWEAWPDRDVDAMLSGEPAARPPDDELAAARAGEAEARALLAEAVEALKAAAVELRAIKGGGA